MRSLHLTNAWHASSGGIGTFYRALIEQSNREGHEIRLVVPGDTTRTEEAGPFGKVYHLEAPRAPLDPSYRMLYPHRFLFPRTAIQKIINSEQPDLIEISEKYSLPYLGGLMRTGRLPGVRIRPPVVGISHERMDENIYANCGLFVHPNPREPFGIAPLKAMASGTPLLVPNAGGVLSYANEDNAWLAPPDAEAFAAGVEQVFSASEQRKCRALAARETGKRSRGRRLRLGF